MFGNWTPKAETKKIGITWPPLCGDKILTEKG
jgi:hypothetical protein